jgi:hypothetical protein
MAAVLAVVAIVVVSCSGEGASGAPTVVTVAESTTGVDATLSASELTSTENSTTVKASDDGHPFGPPEEALAACEQKAESDTCSFIRPRDGSAVDGTCHARRDDASQLACRPNDRPRRGDGEWSPPEESLAACEGINTGTACSFEAPFGTVNGICSEGPGDSGQVVCRPERDGERGPGEGRPGREEAKAACAEKQAEANCSVESPFGTVSGTCRTGRDGSTLVCAPNDWPR